ncbi:hypothetical protein SASPL_107200 [Salvia splendens]|uniref:Piezo non-specific cation channel R-Ras-binding domain-containing protein n=1 Tax=Salvia splendens TaxID=180675 RepID=A0A8X8YAY1_SALSN|nr:hypothetical protein SASPL_107200 [Salvia splendens]
MDCSRSLVDRAYWTYECYLNGVQHVCFCSIESWRSPTVIYFLVVQLLAGLVAFIEINRSRFGFIGSQDSCWDHFSLLVEQIGYRFRLVCCLLLPAVQLATGISNPSWLSLPFFICSCVGLVDWSLTSNFLGLFRWWKLLWVYGGFNIGLLYVYQLPVGLAQSFQGISDSIGLYKASVSSDWQEICSGISLMVFYYMLSFVKHDLEDMEFMMSMREGSLTEQLLPTRNSFFVRQLRSGVRHTNILLRGSIFRFFSINWFTYGFPVSLFALSYWSFSFASICAFALLAYVGYVLYAFPSLIWLHRLNGLLLVFILLWAISTYIFNVAFAYVNWKLGKDMEIWEMVGLWHYPIPGFFLLAQFCLGVLVALGNLVNNSVFFFLSNEERQLSDENRIEEVKEDAKVLIVATIAWGLRKCARPIMLLLIFLIAAKPGLVHAVYIIFFFAYLLSHQINKRMRQCLILLCEAHFAALYILQLSLVSRKLEQKGSISLELLQELGFVKSDSTWEFLEIALLACLCAIHNHGFEMLFSFSKTVQRTPYPPIGFGILKAGLNKSVLLSVYTTFNFRDHRDNSSHERRVALYLSAIGEKFLSIYRSFGTYIAFLTILFAVYLVRPNYTSFGYIFLLLIWIIGRQLVERTKQRLWFPLKAYAIVVFIFIYSLSIFPTLETWMSKKVNLFVCFGYNTEASLLENLWESLAIVIVMQLYSYERRQSKRMNLEDADPLQFGILGFIKRFLIWHSQKILLVALFYASLSPISAFGFLYILGLILSSALPKASRIPSKSFLIYTGFLISVEYLFQIWGTLAQMFPGQKHHELSLFLGLQVYAPSLKGLEAGLRPKVLVIAACILQYNVFHWLERMSGSLLNAGRSKEPCPLFVSEEDVSTVVLTPSRDSEASSESSELPRQRIRSNSRSSFRQANDQVSQDLSPGTGFHENGSNRKFSFGYIWGSIKESHKWNKKRVVSLRQERFEMQKTMLKVYLKFWIENMFNLFGLEINMLALLLASFALLNAVSLFYIASLATCVLLARPIIQRLWPVFVTLFAIILLAEYFAMWSTMMPFSQHVPTPTDTCCHDCWKNSSIYFQYCEMCWLGVVVDDPRMLISYCMVFMLACFKLRADRAPSYSWSSTYQQMVSQHKNASVWRDISFETKSMWTILDYLRVYCYCHLLDLVLTLILITGTLEYDILHLGYLGFALIFFRMRLSILKKKNKIFKFLRVYNFAVIVLSLAYQSPFVGDFTAGKCETVDYIYEVIGFYKYDYGFRITSRSALVEIIIFVLVSCQSYMFSSSEFDYVFRYLEAEQIGAIVREQEKKATWKTEQLQHIRESEEKKRQRNLQVEKMKAEMLNLQIQLHGMNSPTAGADSSPAKEGLRRRKNVSLNSQETGNAEKQDGDTNADLVFPSHLYESPRSFRAENPFAVEFTKPQMYASFSEITEVRDDASYTAGNDSDEVKKGKAQSKENHLASAVQLIGDGVSQVQSIGNQAVSSLANFLNISPEDSDSNEPPSLQDGRSTDERSTNDKQTHLSSSSSVLSDKSRTSGFASWQIGRIIRHIWSQIRSNNDIVCYCFHGILGGSVSICSLREYWAKYWKSLTQEAESPPHFIQLSMDVKAWPEDGIQPERIESGINRLLQLVHDENCKNEMLNPCPCASKVQIRSIEKSSENPGVALAVFEVVYVSSLTDCKPAAQINSLTPASDIAKEILRAQEKELNFKVGFPYCIISVIGGGRREIDLYAYIFGADLTVFFLVAIFYQLVIKNKSEILEYYQLEDQFPKEYVFMLMIIFFLIVVDRVIYLCSFATGKVIFYIFSIFLFTYAVTQYAWNMDTSRKSTAGLAIRAIYLTKAVSLVLQAMQIRYGVPHQSTLYRQFLTSEVSRVNYLGYRLYRALPFLYELRCVLDWSCTATSLTMYDWLKVSLQVFYRLEDINASLYLVKCDNVLNRASHKQGEKQTKMTKLCNGICLFFILICVIWTPMLMYSSGNPTNIANPVNDASFQFEIKTNGGRLILYQTTLCEIIPWDKVQSNDVDPQNYLDSYNANDIQLICCQADASTLWLVPAVVQKQFIQSLYGGMEMKISWIVTRDRPKGKEKVKYDKSVDPSNLPDPSEVERVLNGSSASSSFRIYNIYPRNFRVTGSGEVRPVDQVSLVNADLVLHRETHDWWSFQDINSPDADACRGLSGPMAVVVSEESPQGFLGETLSKFSIWGLYITFVLAVGRFIRMQCSDLRMRIPFENLPSCDRLIAICEDIYAARAEGELGVEEVLYWTLVKIYRSPHMLLEYTKPD